MKAGSPNYERSCMVGSQGLWRAGDVKAVSVEELYFNKEWNDEN